MEEPQVEARLSVLVPVFNERYLVGELLRRLLALSIPGIREMEIIVVDDGSTDGTRELLRELAGVEPRIRLFEHEVNGGKGAAIRTGLEHATGDLIVFQDADLEYDPRDLARLVDPLLHDGADVVYGSRFLAGDRRRVLYFRHSLGNRFVTFVSNLFSDLNLTDIETCYKMFRAPLLKSLPIRSNRFGIEPELTAKIAKRGFRVFEVPISYLGRTYREGKKIGWRDGISALWTILRFWVQDDLYAEDEYGSHILTSLEKAQRFNRWMADSLAPDVGTRVLEIGAGIGNISQWLVPRDRYLATDINPHYLHYLANYASGKPYFQVARVDLEEAADFDDLKGRFDTVICLNVLEHITDPIGGLRNIYRALAPGGRLLLYVPQGQGLYSSLDEVLGHRCRYDRASLTEELGQVGFEIEFMRDFNRSAVPGWWWNGKILRRRSFSRLQLKIFDLMVPVLHHLDALVPWRGLGLMASARKPARKPEGEVSQP